MTDREKKLRELVGDDIKAVQIVEEIIFLEEELKTLKTLPFIKTHPTDKTKQKATPAAKLYKEMLQQYTSCIRVLLKICGEDGSNEDSPLRKWVREREKNLDA